MFRTAQEQHAHRRKQNQGKVFPDVFREFDLRELRLIEPLRAMRVLNYSAWLAKRWRDPAFPASFPWFNTPRYWSEHILELKELLSSLQEAPLTMPQ